MKSYTFKLSIVTIFLFSTHLYAQTKVEKAFNDLEKEIGGCLTDLQTKNALIGKATSELQRLDGLVTALKSDIEQKDKHNKQLTEKVTNSESKIVELQVISNDAQACADKSFDATQNLTVAIARNGALKNQLELSAKKNEELIAQNRNLRQQLLESNSELTRLKNTSVTKLAETVQLPSSVKNENLKDNFSISISNIDDQVEVLVNGELIGLGRWGKNGIKPDWIDAGHRAGEIGALLLDSYLKPGKNEVRVRLWNSACCGSSVSFQIKSGDKSLFEQSYTKQSSTKGWVYDESFI